MVFANIDDHRKPFLSALFAVISLATATFVYLAADGLKTIHHCDIGGNPISNTSTLPSTTTATATTTTTGTTTTSAAPAPTGAFPYTKYHNAAVGGIAINALLAASAIIVVLAVYCRWATTLRAVYAFLCVQVLALLYPMVVFGPALSAGNCCHPVGARVVPASVALFVIGLSTLLFFSETLSKIREGDEGPSANAPLIRG